MQFVDGQTVVHPHHGPATVTGVVDRRFRDTRRRYVGLRVHRTDLDVMVPMDQAEEIGLRRVCSLAEIDEILGVLHAPTGDEEELWSRRMKANHERLRLGDLRTTAEVVRDLVRRQEAKGLSAGEKDLLRSASRPVLAELCLALSLTDEEADEALEAAVLGPERLTARRLAHLERGSHPELTGS